MRTTQQFSVTLPNEMAKLVKTKVSSGEYGTESEVIREGLRALQAQERALKNWLQTEVAAAYDEVKANPSGGVPIEDVRTRLAAIRAKRS
jgi:antitoxin ParD1/3/4